MKKAAASSWRCWESSTKAFLQAAPLLRSSEKSRPRNSDSFVWLPVLHSPCIPRHVSPCCLPRPVSHCCPSCHVSPSCPLRQSAPAAHSPRQPLLPTPPHQRLLPILPRQPPAADPTTSAPGRCAMSAPWGLLALNPTEGVGAVGHTFHCPFHLMLLSTLSSPLPPPLLLLPRQLSLPLPPSLPASVFVCMTPPLTTWFVTQGQARADNLEQRRRHATEARAGPDTAIPRACSTDTRDRTMGMQYGRTHGRTMRTRCGHTNGGTMGMWYKNTRHKHKHTQMRQHRGRSITDATANCDPGDSSSKPC